MRVLIRNALFKSRQNILEDIRNMLSGSKPSPPPFNLHAEFSHALISWFGRAEELRNRNPTFANIEIKLHPIQPQKIVKNFADLREVVRSIVFDDPFDVSLPFGYPFVLQKQGDIKFHEQNIYAIIENPHLQMWQLAKNGSLGIIENIWSENRQRSELFNHPPPPERLIPIEYICKTVRITIALVKKILDYFEAEHIAISYSLDNISKRHLGSFTRGLNMPENYYSLNAITFMKIYPRLSLFSDDFAVRNEITSEIFAYFQGFKFQCEA